MALSKGEKAGAIALCALLALGSGAYALGDVHMGADSGKGTPGQTENPNSTAGTITDIKTLMADPATAERYAKADTPVDLRLKLDENSYPNGIQFDGSDTQWAVFRDRESTALVAIPIGDESKQIKDDINSGKFPIVQVKGEYIKAHSKEIAGTGITDIIFTSSSNIVSEQANANLPPRLLASRRRSIRQESAKLIPPPTLASANKPNAQVSMIRQDSTGTWAIESIPSHRLYKPFLPSTHAVRAR